jgi:hypothetical protein
LGGGVGKGVQKLPRESNYHGSLPPEHPKWLLVSIVEAQAPPPTTTSFTKYSLYLGTCMHPRMHTHAHSPPIL